MKQAQTGEKSISAEAADKLIAAHDGDVALLYIYMLRTGCTDSEQAARALCRTLSAIDDAEEKLRRMGLLPISSAPRPQSELPIAPVEELPEYKAEDIVRRSKEDPSFAAIAVEAQKVLGHVLSSADLKRLFGIYDYLSLPPEVILELLNHCVERSVGRRPSMRYIEKEAYTWVNREIFTLDQAEEYIQLSKRRSEESGKLCETLQIHGRALSPSEEKYISSWLEMGFKEDAVAIAFDRTVTNTGKLSWGYMNTILQSWHKKGLHSADEINEKDSRRRDAVPAQGSNGKAINMDELRSMMDKM